MSATRHRPEHLIIREYLLHLLAKKRITREGLRDAFIGAYLEQVPPGEDVPAFDPVHRHDTPEQMRRKDDANLKKLWRAIEGKTFFPLAFVGPIIEALDALVANGGIELQKLLLHNAGLYHLPIDISGKAPALYAEVLQEFAEMNTQIVKDMSDDGLINSEKTRKEILDSLEKHLALLRELEKNREGSGNGND